jgi:hypothetical protein
MSTDARVVIGTRLICKNAMPDVHTGLALGRTYTVKSFVEDAAAAWGDGSVKTSPGVTLNEVPGYYRLDRFVVAA